MVVIDGGVVFESQSIIGLGPGLMRKLMGLLSLLALDYSGKVLVS